VQNDNEDLVEKAFELMRNYCCFGQHKDAEKHLDKLVEFLRKHLRPAQEAQYKGVLQGLGKVNFEQKPSGKRFEYKIVYQEDISDFQQIISEQLNIGWQLAGGVFLARDYYCQPLMRITDEG
jgi:tetratricopeptide (TPR) repeat protein